MKIRIGITILLHDKKRLFLSTAGIAFAVMIMFMQIGFFNGINDSQSAIARMINADLVLISTNRTTLNKWNRFDPVSLHKVIAFPEVREGIPIYKDGTGLKNPETGQIKRVIVYAYPATSSAFNLPDMSRRVEDTLKINGNVLFDRRSREIYGDFSPGDTISINNNEFNVSGVVTVGPNLINDGTILMNDGTWIGQGGNRRPIMSLIRLKEGQDKAKAIASIKSKLPEELLAYTPENLAKREVVYMVTNTPVGAIFGIGLVVSLVIGTIICYQVLFNEVTDHIPQYATLKAMGFGPRSLIVIILEQAIALGIIGFIPGYLVAIGMYDFIDEYTRLLMLLTPERIGVIFILTLIMCIFAGMLAVRKVLKVDPAELY